MMKYLVLTVYIALLCLNPVYSDPVRLNKELYAIHYGQHNGLPTTTIFDLVQDDQGFLYMATGKGLYRYDGFSFQSMNENIDNYMGGSALSVFRKDHIFFESFDGYVYQFHQKKWTSFNVHKPVHFLPYGIHEDTLFVVQKRGVDIYHITDSEYIRTVSFPVGAPQHTLQVGPDYFLINEDHLIKTNSRTVLKSIPVKNLSSTKTIRQLYHYQDKLYVTGRSAYQEGIWVFDRNLNHLYTIRVNELEGIIQHIDFIDGKVWISTNKGIFVYENPNDQWKFRDKLFSGANVSRILKGKNNEYWISVIGKGLYLVPNPEQFVYSLPDEGISRIISDTEEYWAGTSTGNIYRLNDHFSSASFVLQTPQVNTPINFLYHNPSGKDLFYVSAMGFFHNTPGDQQFYDLALKSVADIDPHYYALATSSHLLLYAKPDQPVSDQASLWDVWFNRHKDAGGFASLMDGLRSKTVCYDSKSGTLYVLTNAGIFVADKTGSVEELLINQQPVVADQMQLAEQKLYYLTYSGELQIFSEGKVTKLEIDSRVLDFKLFGVSLVLKTNSGFIIYHIKENSFTPVHFKCEPASVGDFLLHQDKLIVLLPTGLTEVPVTTTAGYHDLPGFMIESIKTGEKSVYDVEAPLKLSYDSNSLEINYTILDYTYASTYSLYYRINRGNWEKLPANSRKLQFHQLSSGNYQVEFRINDQLLNQSVYFSIERPYWESWWFYLLLSIGTALLISYYYRQRRKKLQARIKLLEDKVMLEKQLGKSLLTSIKAQMNPHFYFNALNSIQAFIYKNDKERALEYLSKFSKLTRNILTQTEMDSIPLEEEIATLRLYLDLEKVRFSDRFSYTLESTPESATSRIRIPAMLIQPYVENAVKHGFTKATTNGLIRIIFETAGNYLIVTVEDNGIGREQSAALRKNDTQPSFSSDANKRRLEILNANTDDKVSVQYEDNINETGSAGGTRVKIFIPINLPKP